MSTDSTPCHHGSATLAPITPTSHMVWALYARRDADTGGVSLQAELVVGWSADGEALVIDGDGGSAMQLCGASLSFMRLVPDVCKRAEHPDVRRAIALAQSDLGEAAAS